MMAVVLLANLVTSKENDVHETWPLVPHKHLFTDSSQKDAHSLFTHIRQNRWSIVNPGSRPVPPTLGWVSPESNGFHPVFGKTAALKTATSLGDAIWDLSILESPPPFNY